ncbi:MAG: hypothetical protein H6686_08565 [Fibrobacteria bacterium]|nr:hypothetical protein [Fibrobacteria bacterium]
MLAFQIQYGLQNPDSLLWSNLSVAASGGLVATPLGIGIGWNITGWSNTRRWVSFTPGQRLEQGEKIRVSFKCTINDSLADSTRGWDGIRVGVYGGSDIDSIRFHPGGTAGRRVEVDLINTSNRSSAYLYIGGTTKEAVGSPAMRLEDLQVRRISRPRYIWVDDPTEIQKAQVRAFRLLLLVRTSKRSLPARQEAWESIADLPPIDPGASSDGKASALFERIIPVVNNGI